MAELVFVGTGEAFDGELPTSSLLYRGRRTILLDCGYAVPHALWRITRNPDVIDAITISHSHADHSFGLPPLVAWMKRAGRTRPLFVIGQRGIEPWLNQLLEMGYPTAGLGFRFPIVPLELVPGSPIHVGPIELSSAYSLHGVDNLAVRVSDGSTSFCYSGDGAPSEATRLLFQGANVLVHECLTVSRNVEGHATLRVVVDLAEACQVKMLCLVHVAEEEREAMRAALSTLPTTRHVLLPRPGDCFVLPIGPRVQADR